MKTEIIKSKHHDSWFVNRWRPAAAWVYMFICLVDFVIFPVLWSLLQAAKSGQVTMPHQPLTLQGGGLFHMSFGAILGVAAWSRGQEKQAILASTIPPMYSQTTVPNTPPQPPRPVAVPPAPTPPPTVSPILAPDETPIR